jgi:tRNA(Ile)-lysidine synthase
VSLLHQVRRSVVRRRLISPGDRGAVALSGGPDSLSLLHVLSRLSTEIGFRLGAVHVDHGLRQESAEEAARVRELGRVHGVEVTLVGAKVAAGNVQEQARRQRLGLVGRHAAANNLDWIALGHTSNDQAETVLMRALRGTGVHGLGGMAWRRELVEAGAAQDSTSWLIRPMLDVTRPAVDAYVERHELQPLEDPTNATDQYLRNRLRRRVLPLLAEENPQVVDALCRLADICREEDQTLEQIASQSFQRAWGGQELQLRELNDLPRGLQGRVIRQAHGAVMSRSVSSPPPPLERCHVDAVLELVKAPHGTRGLDLPGARVERRYERLCWVTGPRFSPPSFDPTLIQGPGRYDLSDGRMVLVERTSSPQELDVPLAEDALLFPLVLRPRHAGDKIRTGASVTRKVARVLMDAKIPRELRGRVPILVNGDGALIQILGLRQGFGRAVKRGEPGLLVRLGGGAQAVG